MADSFGKFLGKYSIRSLYDRNNSSTRAKIQLELLKVPSATDSDGYVYGYNIPGKYHPSARNNFHIKLGRTAKNNPNDRIVRQWGGEIQFCEKTIWNKKLERLIHLFFDFARFDYIQPNGAREIEWFQFKEKINIKKYISILNEIVDDTFGEIAVPSSIPEIKRSAQININSAPLSQLMSLPSIGPILAQRIIAHRPFKSTANIMLCERIGKKTFAKISELICVR
ncbi:MAG: helix-hairpin-helix motif protein [Hyperionvirus sp.]|uniref:Helix-hairpin-helix motif protein n=1 Tax=Hyperionvirus sp. TaxID=2487770 RepID=A0A3G5A5L4_9VIRU|nr:MAG: helix-hairpin-helix motif protein [Hyperionvirus sp.]